MPELENLVVRMLQDIREGIRRVDTKVDTLGGDLRSEMHSLRADVASDLLNLEMRLNEQNAALRRSVIEYHSSAVGHGILYSGLEERVRRIEQKLDMAPSGAH